MSLGYLQLAGASAATGLEEKPGTSFGLPSVQIAAGVRRKNSTERQSRPATSVLGFGVAVSTPVGDAETRRADPRLIGNGGSPKVRSLRGLRLGA